jgi:WD40 repeat protein
MSQGFPRYVRGGELKAWHIESGKERWSATGNFAGIWGVAFAPDGQTVAGASLDGTIRIWEAATGKQTHVLQGHTDRAIWVAFTPSGATIKGHTPAPFSDWPSHRTARSWQRPVTTKQS